MRLAHVIRGRSDLGLAILLAALALLLSLWPGEPGALRLILGGPLVLVIPGYVLSVALVPDTTLDWPTRVLFTGGLSIACLALGSLALNILSFGLNAMSWTVFICVLTVVAAVVAFIRTYPLTQQDTVRQQRPRLIGVQAGLYLLAELVLLGAMAIALTPVPEQPQQGYTLLWALPRDSGQGSIIQLGVHSLESDRTDYHLQVVSGNDVIRDVPLSLRPAEEWQADLTLPDGASGAYEALLYRDDSPGIVYRRVLVRVGAPS